MNTTDADYPRLHKKSATSCKLTNDAKLAISNHGAGELSIVWDTHQRKEVHRFSNKDGIPFCMTLSGDGRRALRVFVDGVVELLDTSNWGVKHTHRFEHELLINVERVLGCHLDDHGSESVAVFVTDQHSLVLLKQWSHPSCPDSWRCYSLRGKILDYSVSFSQQLLAYATTEGDRYQRRYCFLDLPSFFVIQYHPLHGLMAAVSVAEVGPLAVLADTSSLCLVKWGKRGHESSLLPNYSASSEISCAISADGSRILATTRFGFGVWDARRKSYVAWFDSYKAYSGCRSLTPNGTTFVTGCDNGSVHLFRGTPTWFSCPHQSVLLELTEKEIEMKETCTKYARQWHLKNCSDGVVPLEKAIDSVEHILRKLYLLPLTDDSVAEAVKYVTMSARSRSMEMNTEMFVDVFYRLLGNVVEASGLDQFRKECTQLFHLHAGDGEDASLRFRPTAAWLIMDVYEKLSDGRCKLSEDDAAQLLGEQENIRPRKVVKEDFFGGL